MDLLQQVAHCYDQKSGCLQIQDLAYHLLLVFKNLVINLSIKQIALNLFQNPKQLWDQWLNFYHVFCKGAKMLKQTQIILIASHLCRALHFNEIKILTFCKHVFYKQPSQSQISVFNQCKNLMKLIIQSMHKQYLFPFVILDIPQEEEDKISLDNYQNLPQEAFQQARSHLLDIIEQKPFQLIYQREKYKGVTLHGLFIAINFQHIHQYLPQSRVSVIFTMLHQLAHLKRRIHKSRFKIYSTPQNYKDFCSVNKPEAGFFWSTMSFKVGKSLLHKVIQREQLAQLVLSGQYLWQDLTLFKKVYGLALYLLRKQKIQYQEKSLSKTKNQEVQTNYEQDEWCLQVPSREEVQDHLDFISLSQSSRKKQILKSSRFLKFN